MSNFEYKVMNLLKKNYQNESGVANNQSVASYWVGIGISGSPVFDDLLWDR